MSLSNTENEFRPKIGFEKSIENSSFTFSDDMQDSLKSESLEYLTKDLVNIEGTILSNNTLNESNGLNQAFIEENSESISLGEPVKFINTENDKTDLKIFSKIEDEVSQIIVSQLQPKPSDPITEVPQSVEVKPAKQKKKSCCGRLCNIF